MYYFIVYLVVFIIVYTVCFAYGCVCWFIVCVNCFCLLNCVYAGLVVFVISC